MKFYKNLKLRTNDPVVAGKQIKDALKEYKVVKVTPEWYLNDLREFYDVVTEQIGEVNKIREDFTKGGAETGEKWMEIQYDHDIPDMAAFRHSKNAQPLHTDESYRFTGGVRLFYCVNMAEEGGETTFVDGPVLIDYLKNYDPDFLKELTTEDIKYSKADNSRTEKIIEISPEGDINFNFNYFCIDKNETEAHKDLNKRFHEFLQNQVANSYMMEKVLLRPGEGLAWWDRPVLHGRNSYKASKTNDRLIWKTGVKWSES
jgi:alpha-ketoglutarate-dependent taurine dioxygenase